MNRPLPHRRLRRTVAALVLGSLALVAAACGGSSEAGGGSDAKVKVGYFKGGAFGAQVAKAKKYFEDEGIDVEFVPLQAGPAILQATAVKQVDIGYGDVYAWASGITNGFDNVKLITPANNTLGWLYAGKSSGVSSAADLAGKKIGVTPTPFPKALVKNWLEHHGVDSSKVTFSTVAVGSQASALKSGSVDAVFSFDFVTNARLAAVGGHQVADLAKGLVDPDTANAAYYANTDFLKKNPDAAEAFVKAVRKASAYFDQADAATKAKFTGLVTGADLKTLSKKELPGLLDEPTWTTLLDGPLDVEATQRWVDLGVKYKAVPKRVDISQHLYKTATS